MIELSSHLRIHLGGGDVFDQVLNLQGKTYRHVKHRRTLETEIGGRRYFVKVHRGCGWGEILKDLFQGRPPVTGAESEWRAIEKLHELGVPTVIIAGKGMRGRNPASRESFLITEPLEGMISLEQLVQQNWTRLDSRRRMFLKRALINELARMARTLHLAGMNHRDFYLCHFLVKDRDWPEWGTDDNLRLHLIDLHRAQIRPRTPGRWLGKDLAALLFSALDAGLTNRDLCRFLRGYCGVHWRTDLRSRTGFWRGVRGRAGRLYEKFHGKPASGPLG
jgi:heptose I phosphotransferase